MDGKKIIVEKSYITINERKVLENYWYKYVVRMIQLILEKYEEPLLELVGEEAFDEFCELTDDAEELINGIGFSAEELPLEISNIENEIAKSIYNRSTLCFGMQDKTYDINKEQYDFWTDSFFKNQIIPYLQLKNEESVIESSVEYLKLLLEEQIKKAGLKVAVKKEKREETVEIHLVKEDNSIIRWCDNGFEIVNDLYGYIPIRLNIHDADGKNRNLYIELCFPFYKKGDQVNVNIQNNGTKWSVLAINNNNIKCIREIKL